MQLVCWQCANPAGGPLFCDSCGALQAPPSDFFDFFGLPERLALDAADLQQRFYALTKRLHPDRFTRRPAAEQAHSLEASSILNDGYRVLRDPVERAEYVLRKRGMAGSETRSAPPELLEEVFELNMALEELRAGDDSARPQIESALAGFRAMLEEADGDLDAAFQSWDSTGADATLQRVRSILDRRKYIRNLVRDAGAALAAPAA